MKIECLCVCMYNINENDRKIVLNIFSILFDILKELKWMKYNAVENEK